MQKKRISKYLKKRLLSFKYAFNGIAYVIKTQANMQIHFFLTIIVIIAGFYFKISTVEWLFLLLTIALVLVSETINTAIEEIVNFISPEYNKKAGIIKDLSAAFVLLAAIFAVIVGILIFLPKILFIIKN